MGDSYGTQPWEKIIHRESGFRRCIILYGNVRDIWTTTEGKIVGLSEYVSESLSSKFKVRGIWDGVDGLRFPNRRHLSDFQDRLESSAIDIQEGEEYSIDDGLGRDSQERSGPVSAPEVFSSASNAFPAIREVMSSSFSKTPLFIIDWAEHLVHSPNRQELDERVQLTNLSKAVSEQPASQLSSQSLNNPTGLLVIITPTLGDIPSKIYCHDSRVKIVPIQTPDLSARDDFVQTYLSRDFILRESSDGATPLSQIVEMSDGMTKVDLRNLAALSRQNSPPLKADSLIQLYRFGEKESPWTKLDEYKLNRAYEIFLERVMGQEEAIESVRTMLIRAYLGLSGIQHSRLMTKPKGTLFFVGPTGVGKTELAKAIAELVFGDEANCIRFDMSEYSHEHSDQRLIGAPPGYVGFEEGGQLTNAVSEKPFSVLLFDEIEKAHPRVLDKFLQILEDGRLTDGRGQTVHFSETVIIFTSNIGASETPVGVGLEEARSHFLDAVSNHFNRVLGRPELLNRFGDNIIVFNQIDDPDDRRDILKGKMESLHVHLMEKFNISLEIDEEYVQRLSSMGKISHGGRGIINVIEREVVNPLSSFIFRRLHLIGEERLSISVSEGNFGEARFELGD